MQTDDEAKRWLQAIIRDGEKIAPHLREIDERYAVMIGVIVGVAVDAIIAVERNTSLRLDLMGRRDRARDNRAYDSAAAVVRLLGKEGAEPGVIAQGILCLKYAPDDDGEKKFD
jgi:hypothetical protein